MHKCIYGSHLPKWIFLQKEVIIVLSLRGPRKLVIIATLIILGSSSQYLTSQHNKFVHKVRISLQVNVTTCTNPVPCEKSVCSVELSEGMEATLCLHYTTLHYTTLHYTTLHYTTLHYTTLHYTTLHYTTLHYTTLHFTTLHYTQGAPGAHWTGRIQLSSVPLIPCTTYSILQPTIYRGYSPLYYTAYYTERVFPCIIYSLEHTV